jgi:hypothetical protein
MASRSSAMKSTRAAHEVRTQSGASARVEGEHLVLRDRQGAIVVVHDATTGETVVRTEGDLTFAAGKRVRVTAGTELILEAKEVTRLTTPTLEITAADASAHATRASVNADSITVTAKEHTSLVGKWELRAQRVVEHVIDVYREVDGLDQTRAGRVRTIVKGVFRVLAGRSEVVSKDDNVIDGKRVLLG